MLFPVRHIPRCRFSSLPPRSSRKSSYGRPGMATTGPTNPTPTLGKPAVLINAKCIIRVLEGDCTTQPVRRTQSETYTRTVELCVTLSDCRTKKRRKQAQPSRRRHSTVCTSKATTTLTGDSNVCTCSGERNDGRRKAEIGDEMRWEDVLLQRPKVNE